MLPIAVAATAFGVSFGILARDAGMGVVAPIVMSFTTFAGSAQFASASVLEQGGALVAAIVAAVLLNLRYLAIGISVAPSLRGSRPAGWEAQRAVDESWAVAQDGGRVRRGRRGSRSRADGRGRRNPAASSAAARSATRQRMGSTRCSPPSSSPCSSGSSTTGARCRPRSPAP